MVDWNKTFKAEYAYVRTFLAHEANFSKAWQPLVRDLYKLMDTEGFDPGRASALTDLRKQVTQGEGNVLGYQKITEDKGILTAVGAWTDDGGGSVAASLKMRAAALKLLRHTYLLNRSGNRKVWLLSLPQDFQDWPSDDLNVRASTQIAARILLRSSNEIFSTEQKKHLANAAQHSLAWCQKTGMVLADAAQTSQGKGNAKGVAALNLVKRWFADPTVGVTDLNTCIGTLASGFKAIIAMLNKGHFVLTDWLPLRTATVQDDVDFLYSEAFTFPSRGEGMDTVYKKST